MELQILQWNMLHLKLHGNKLVIAFMKLFLEDEKEGYIKLSLSEEEVLKWISEYCS